MKVYVVQLGFYENTVIAGVYSTLELAMLVHRKGVWRWRPSWEHSSLDTLGRWDNGLAWYDSANIQEHEVDPPEARDERSRR